jgi:hypothetical protein
MARPTNQDKVFAVTITKTVLMAVCSTDRETQAQAFSRLAQDGVIIGELVAESFDFDNAVPSTVLAAFELVGKTAYDTAMKAVSRFRG